MQQTDVKSAHLSAAGSYYVGRTRLKGFVVAQKASTAVTFEIRDGSATGDIFTSAVPRPQAFIDTGIRVFRCLLAGKFLLHPSHPCTERVAPAAAFWLGRFQVHALLFG